MNEQPENWGRGWQAVRGQRGGGGGVGTTSQLISL